MARQNKLSKDELAALKNARNAKCMELMKAQGLNTKAGVEQYRTECTVGAGVMLIASLDENGIHMTSANAVRYRPIDVGEGTLFLNKADVYLRKDFLEAQGYEEEGGWPVAFWTSFMFPGLVDEEAPEINEELDDGDTYGQVDDPGTLTVSGKSGNITKPEQRGTEQPEQAEQAEQCKASCLDHIRKPKKPWKAHSTKALGVIRDLAAEYMADSDIAEEDARELARTHLVAKGYMLNPA